MPTRVPAAVVAAAPAPAPTRPPPRRQPPVIPPAPPAEISYASGSPRLAPPHTAPASEPVPSEAEAAPALAPAPRPEPTHEPAMRTRTFNGAANLPLARLELEGIVYSDANPTALISGHVVRPGSYVEGYTVLSIGRDRVELQGENEKIVLILH